MTIEKYEVLKKVFDCLETWEMANVALEDAAESEELDLAEYIQAVEEGRIRLILAWKELKLFLKKEKDDNAND